MKKYVTIYYLLCVVLILGAFAAMAQNGYGLVLLGVVAAFFAIVFLAQLVTYLDKYQDNRDNLLVIEHVSLILISSILSLRIFYIRFMFVEEIFILSGLMLALVFSVRLVRNYITLVSKNNVMAWTVLLFQASIVLYIVSMALAPLYPPLSEPAGILAFLSLLAFTISGFINNNFLLDGENLTAFSFINRFRDHSIVLIALFLIFTSYMGLTKFEVVPKMYSDEYPQAYFELVKQAEAGDEEAINGKYKHEEFKELYDQFVSRNMLSDSK
jgi:hypothetical protein